LLIEKEIRRRKEFGGKKKESIFVFFSCIYKHGDELLQDAMCVAVMKEMNHIFEEENVNAEVVLYEVGEFR
jgi:hypothetical protein